MPLFFVCLFHKCASFLSIDIIFYLFTLNSCHMQFYKTNPVECIKALYSRIFSSIYVSVIAEHLITRKQAIRFYVTSPFLGQLVTMDNKISAMTHRKCKTYFFFFLLAVTSMTVCLKLTTAFPARPSRRRRFDHSALRENLPCRNPSWRQTREALTSARGRPGKTNSHFNLHASR